MRDDCVDIDATIGVGCEWPSRYLMRWLSEPHEIVEWDWCSDWVNLMRWLKSVHWLNETNPVTERGQCNVHTHLGSGQKLSWNDSWNGSDWSN